MTPCAESGMHTCLLRLQAAQAALNARFRGGAAGTSGRASSAAALEDSEGNAASAGGEEEGTAEGADRVKERLEQAERAVEKFVARRLKAVQPGLEKVRWREGCAVVIPPGASGPTIHVAWFQGAFHSASRPCSSW